LDEARQKLADADRLLAEAEGASSALPEAPAGEDAVADADPVEAARKALAFERSVQAAQAAQSGAKTCLVMKRLAAKRLSESASEVAGKELDELQARADAVGSKLTTLRARAVEVKMAALKRKR